MGIFEHLLTEARYVKYRYNDESITVEEALDELYDLFDAGFNVSSRTALKTKDPGTYFLSEGSIYSSGGRSGWFTWDATVPIATHQADKLRTQSVYGDTLTADIGEAIFIAPNPAAIGAWVRVRGEEIRYEWAGGLYGTGLTTAQQINNCAALQHIVDLVIYAGVAATPTLGTGILQYYGTLHVGYGQAIHSCILRGAGRRYRGAIVGSGTAIFHTGPITQQAVNLAGCRASAIEGITFQGILWNLYSTLNGGGGADPSLRVSWSAIGGDGRYNPYAGITFDAYAGTAPGATSADRYPTFTVPAWIVGEPGGYGRTSRCSVMRIHDVGVGGFNTLIVNQPGDSDGNGDFPAISDCFLEMGMFIFSGGNSQCRNWDIQNTQVLVCWVLFTNNTHGQRNGRFGGVIIDLAIDSVTRIFELSNTSVVGTMTFKGFYGENLFSLGSIGTNSASVLGITIEGGLLDFQSQAAGKLGCPAYVLEGTSQAEVVFKDMFFGVFPSVLAFQPPNVRFENSFIAPTARDSGTIGRAQAHMHNMLAGGIVVAADNIAPQRIRFKVLDTETGSVATSENCGFNYRSWKRRYTASIYARDLIRVASQGGRRTERYPLVSSADKGSFTSVTIVGDQLTIVTAAIQYYDAMFNGYVPGCGIRDQATGTFWVITSFTGPTFGGGAAAGTIVATQQNNLKGTPWGGGVFSAISTSVGSFEFWNALMYGAGKVVEGDTSSASAIISDCADREANNFANSDPAADAIAAGDMIVSQLFKPNAATIAAGGIDTGARTITMSTNAQETRSGVPFGLWLRAPPPNV